MKYLFALLIMLFAPTAFAEKVVCRAQTRPSLYLATFELNDGAVTRAELVVSEGQALHSAKLDCEAEAGADEPSYQCKTVQVRDALYSVRLYSTGSPELFAGITRRGSKGNDRPEQVLPCRTED